MKMFTVTCSILVLLFSFAHSSFTGPFSSNSDALCYYMRHRGKMCQNRMTVINVSGPYGQQRACEAACDDPNCVAAVWGPRYYQTWDMVCKILDVADGPCRVVGGRTSNYYYDLSVKRTDLNCLTHSPTPTFPSLFPTPVNPSLSPTPVNPTIAPSLSQPSQSPSTVMPSLAPTTDQPTLSPSFTSPTQSPLSISECRWEPVPTDHCPPNDYNQLRNMEECTLDMRVGELCEADRALPDGNSDFNINNCGAFDVFRVVCDHEQVACNPNWIPIDSDDCPSYWDLMNRFPQCTTDMVIGDICSNQHYGMPNGLHFTRNCGNLSVFRWQCTHTEIEFKPSYTDLSPGWCLSGRFTSMGDRSIKTRADCRAECDSRSDCKGYTGTASGGRGTCIIHTSTTYEITHGSDHPQFVCFKRIIV